MSGIIILLFVIIVVASVTSTNRQNNTKPTLTAAQGVLLMLTRLYAVDWKPFTVPTIPAFKTKRFYNLIMLYLEGLCPRIYFTNK